MYYVNKIVGWAMSPMGMLFLGLCLGIGLRRLRGSGRLRSLGAWVMGLTLVGFWILGCGVTTRLVGVPLEGEEVGRVDRVERVEAIVCLGGGIGKHERCGRTELFGGADRAWEAAKMWKIISRVEREERVDVEGLKEKKIFCTGKGCAEATIPLLVDLGVPCEAIVGLDEARNTQEEAKLIAATGIRRILLVTSAWHMPRAKMLFERAGMEVVEAPCDYEMHYVAEEPLKVGDFFPNSEALMRNSYAIKEWVARAGYALLRR